MQILATAADKKNHGGVHHWNKVMAREKERTTNVNWRLENRVHREGADRGSDILTWEFSITVDVIYAKRNILTKPMIFYGMLFINCWTMISNHFDEV